jgi:hypothetical protein
MYPKDFFAKQAPHPDSGLCFVLMPFASEFDAVWRTVQETISGPPFNMLCRRADDVSVPGNIVSGILDNISRARIIVAELSGRNPNVFYELGIAHSVKPSTNVILLSSEELPFDISHLNTVIYRNSLERLREGLSAALSQLGIRQYPLVLQEGQTDRIPARLTGIDKCLYDIEITLEFVGDDGVKFQLRTTRYAAGSAPIPLDPQLCYLGVAEPAMKVPNLDWYLCYSRHDEGHVRFILGGQPNPSPELATS